jgi:hypothetical protein
MSAQDWNLSLRPKFKATRNLHELLPADLDFFVCLSSIAGIIGSVATTMLGTTTRMFSCITALRQAWQAPV